jgi:hypothetical protein
LPFSRRERNSCRVQSLPPKLPGCLGHTRVRRLLKPSLAGHRNAIWTRTSSKSLGPSF